jgi:tetratricopeptide (TPR) repeat protein
MGKLEETLQKHQRMLEFQTSKHEGHPHVDIATCLANIGHILCRMGKLDAALASHQEGLVVVRKAVGLENLEAATTLDNIGIVLERMGRLDQAMEAHTEALSIRERLVGRNHQDVAKSLGNIGHVYCR